jgi:tRNA1(Val) A37 N6-methylase TrmN6
VDGYRVAIDPVLLAAAVPATGGDQVLELGVGTGAAALCLWARVRDCRVTGLENDATMLDTAQFNIAANVAGNRITAVEGDVTSLPTRMSGAFDHVMANPPYGEAGAGTDPSGTRRASYVQSESSLSEWVGAAFFAAGPQGSVTLIHRAERLPEILTEIAAAGGSGVVVFPLWPKAGATARRVLVRARAGGRNPFRLAAGLVLHEADGRYTVAAERVLRGAESLDL